MQLIQIESLLVQADMLSLAVIISHRCYPNGGIQVVRVAEYIWKVCQGRNKFLVFKVPCYATTSVSQKLPDFFVQLKHK